MRSQLVVVVRSITPGIFAPNTASLSRLSGHSILVIESWKTPMRASTAGLGSNRPTLLFNRKGAVDHRLTSEGTRV